MICSGDGRSEIGERGSVTYVYVYKHEDVCEGMCGSEACDRGVGGESGISGISETVDSSAKRFCTATGVPSREFVTQTDKSGKYSVGSYPMTRFTVLKT